MFENLSISALAKAESNDKFDTAVENFVDAVNVFKGKSGPDSPNKFGGNTPLIQAKTLKEAAKKGQLSRSQFTDPNTNSNYKLFTFQNKTYAIDSVGQVYEFDSISNKVGKRAKMAMGGYISGAGNGTSDSIPAMLSNGEYVIKADSVKKYGAKTFDALNAGKYANGGPVRKLGTADSMIKTAESMLGYQEGKGNDTIFGRFAQKAYDLKTRFIAWCGAFINWAAKKSGVDLASMVWTPGGAQSFKSTGKWKQNPVRGDLAFMNFPGDGVNRISHVGLVRNVLSKNAVSTIEGNTGSFGSQRMGGGVFIKRRKYNEKGAPIVGFGRPSYKPVDNVKYGYGTQEYYSADDAKSDYENERYTVNRGDTLSGIAAKYGITVKQLMEMNPQLKDPKYMGGSRIFAGTKVSIKKFASGGKVTDYITPNGYIRGAGTATSDSIPAMLSNGEYVINAKSVKSVGTPMLDRINKMAMGGPVYNVPAYSMGGRVKYNNGGIATSSNSLYNINVTLNGTDLSADDVANAIERKMRIREATIGRGRNN
jgi:LysM repeat protein